MTDQTQRFSGRVEEYERFRIGFPPQLVAVLRENCGLTSEQTLADIGAGTGKLTEPLLQNGNPVIAVEPNAGMRAYCERLTARFTRLRVVDATAEKTTLDSGSVDMVLAGRSFHWFHPELALREFRRILKPGGWFVIATSHHLPEATANDREYEAILNAHGDRDAETGHPANRGFRTLAPFGDTDHFAEIIPGSQGFTLEQFLGHTQSLSMVPLTDDPGYPEMQYALRSFFSARAVDGELTLHTISDVIGWRVPA